MEELIDYLFWASQPKVYRILSEEEYYIANLEYEEWLAGINAGEEQD